VSQGSLECSNPTVAVGTWICRPRPGHGWRLEPGRGPQIEARPVARLRAWFTHHHFRRLTFQTIGQRSLEKTATALVAAESKDNVAASGIRGRSGTYRKKLGSGTLPTGIPVRREGGRAGDQNAIGLPMSFWRFSPPPQAQAGEHRRRHRIAKQPSIIMFGKQRPPCTQGLDSLKASPMSKLVGGKKYQAGPRARLVASGKLGGRKRFNCGPAHGWSSPAAQFQSPHFERNVGASAAGGYMGRLRRPQGIDANWSWP